MKRLRSWIRERKRSREVRRARTICAKAGHPIDHLSDEEIEKRLALASIRENMRFFGYPVDDMTDAELEEGIQRLGDFIASVGVDPDDLARVTTEVFGEGALK